MDSRVLVHSMEMGSTTISTGEIPLAVVLTECEGGFEIFISIHTCIFVQSQQRIPSSSQWIVILLEMWRQLKMMVWS